MSSDIDVGNIQLSPYVISLPFEAKRRYVEKLKECQCDCPYAITDHLWKNGKDLIEIIPPIRHDEIFMHLIAKHSSLTAETFSAYKNLRADQYLTNGWTKCFNALRLRNGNVIIRAKITHSQSVNDPPLQPWAVLTSDIGKVMHTHCTCAAGYNLYLHISSKIICNFLSMSYSLGEVCIHVSALLHAAVAASQISEQIPITSLPCSWDKPKYEKPVFTSIDFAKFMFD